MTRSQLLQPTSPGFSGWPTTPGPASCCADRSSSTCLFGWVIPAYRSASPRPSPTSGNTSYAMANAMMRESRMPGSRSYCALQLMRFGKVTSMTSSPSSMAPAVEGLRRSGLIRPASRLPWDRVPEFKHDLVRAYSVARYLLQERNPAVALMSIGAPRWTLPSARLACEIVLSAPHEPSHPVAGRFADLQTTFDAIATAGHGERWTDVPTEGLLAVPESLPLLEDAWPALVSDKAHGLARLIRILHGRHQKGGLLDVIITEPVIVRLLDGETPQGLAKEIAELIRDWLQSHVFRETPAGHPTRVKLRQAILEQCAEKERVLDEQDAARQAELAARTPEEIAADEERQNQFCCNVEPPVIRSAPTAAHAHETSSVPVDQRRPDRASRAPRQ